MPCTQFNAYPAASSFLSGDEGTLVWQVGSVRYATASTVAQSAVNWSSGPYQTGFVVKLPSENNFYVSTSDHTGQSPSDRNPAYWVPVLIGEDTTLSVPDDFSSISLALDYLSQAAIAEGVTVTIQVEDGTYNLTTNQINLNHPFSNQIHLIGNVTTPASCILGFTALSTPPTSPYLDSNSGSLFKNDGNTFGLIDGFSITRTSGTAAWGHCGILAYGSRINLGANLIISNFFFQIAAAEGGEILAEGNGAASIEASAFLLAAPGAYAVYANKGKVTIPYLQVTGTENGVALQEGSVARLNNFTSASGLFWVFDLSGGSILTAPDSTVGNANIHIVSNGSASVVDAGSTYGTAATGNVQLSGSLVLNDAFLSADGVAFPFSLVTAGGSTIQRISSNTDSVVVTDAGIDTGAIDLELSADGNAGINIEAATGNVQIPVSAEIGSTSPFEGIQGGLAVLDGSGIAVVAAPWVTANTIITVSGASSSITGPLFASPADISPGVSFQITSDGGAADSGQSVNWHAIVY